MDIACIYCKIDNLGADLSDEHIIPQVLGGAFKIPVVCKKHNDKFGHTLESELKRNGFIVTAIDKLKLQSPNLAYREATIRISLDNETGLKGYIDECGAAKIFTQDLTDNYTVVSDEQTNEVLKKKIQRLEKNTGEKANFTIEKRRSKAAYVTVNGLDKPIPSRVIAKIALTHLAALYYPFVMRDEFDAIKGYILHDTPNRFVLIYPSLRGLEPRSINYLPYHYVRIKFVNGALAAIICLFGTIKFMVFFEEFSDIDEFKPRDQLDNYHVYDINNRNIFSAKGDDE